MPLTSRLRAEINRRTHAEGVAFANRLRSTLLEQMESACDGLSGEAQLALLDDLTQQIQTRAWGAPS